ncbi:MAG: hypothetical protein QOG20_6532 [Pseudonocardiales bacterium]|jgi:hypothetical protein|nr:hypothetical protein [Pseudonocardiales bacterium]
MSAADDYKAVIAAVTDGLDADADRNTARIKELRGLMVDRGKALREASDRHTLTRLVAELAWESALEVLWVETWIQMRPFPRPDRLAKAADLAAHNLAVEERAAELRAAVQRRRLGLPGT